ncbi:hypothetical protein PIB30_024043 [Stylosanthes scabra]|uniref:Transposase (putative) gypsy type domain-containing protein n=1 Tax=Stylosanthes scabra TaxID=79078 RepID=A0ABU6RA20_9FABA|nr:hypothetical protein [Stylosanthes scabra]
MRERKCSFRGEALERVRGLDPKKVVDVMNEYNGRLRFGWDLFMIPSNLSSFGLILNLFSSILDLWTKRSGYFCTFFVRKSSGSGFRNSSNRPIISTCPFLDTRSVLNKKWGRKKSCQEVKVPRPLDAAETRLYGWVEEAVLTQPSVVESDSLPEFRRNFPLMEDSGAEGDYVLEAAGPSDRVPFRAGEEGPHFLWVYQELFTRLRMQLPFSDFQRDVMTRCRVAISQLHLNGWSFILAFEKVCLHYGFRPTIRIFFYIYDVHFPPGGYGYISFRARQGRKLFDSYEDSIQEFKWHYFKVLAASDKRAFWLDHENKPFSWVYWNPEVKDFTVYNLEPLEMAAFKFLVSLPGGLPKRNKFTCRWILDGSDAETICWTSR